MKFRRGSLFGGQGVEGAGKRKGVKKCLRKQLGLEWRPCPVTRLLSRSSTCYSVFRFVEAGLGIWKLHFPDVLAIWVQREIKGCRKRCPESEVAGAAAGMRRAHTAAAQATAGQAWPVAAKQHSKRCGFGCLAAAFFLLLQPPLPVCSSHSSSIFETSSVCWILCVWNPYAGFLSCLDPDQYCLEIRMGSKGRKAFLRETAMCKRPEVREFRGNFGE